MDGSQFDTLARSLGNASRRTMVRRLASAALAGILPLVRGEETDAAKSARNALKRCKKLKGKKKDKCIRRAKNPTGLGPTPPPPPPPAPHPCEGVRCIDEGPASCGTTGVCAEGACLTYDPGTRCRAASCTDGFETLAATCNESGNCPLVRNDCGSAGCGPTACKRANGVLCTTGDECASTHCVGGVCCDQACVGEHASSPGYCGDGICILVCDSGWGNCDGSPPGSCDTPLGTDSDCRHCADGCPFGTFCDGAACVPQYDTGQICARHRQCISDWCISGICCNQNCLPDKCPDGTCRP